MIKEIDSKHGCNHDNDKNESIIDKTQFNINIQMRQDKKDINNNVLDSKVQKMINNSEDEITE